MKKSTDRLRSGVMFPTANSLGRPGAANGGSEMSKLRRKLGVLTVLCGISLGTTPTSSSVGGITGLRADPGRRGAGGADVVLLHGQVGLTGRVPGSLSTESLSGAESASGGRPLLVGQNLHAALSRRWPRRLDVCRRARRASGFHGLADRGRDRQEALSRSGQVPSRGAAPVRDCWRRTGTRR